MCRRLAINASQAHTAIDFILKIFVVEYRSRLGIYLFVKRCSTAAIWEPTNNGWELFGPHRSRREQRSIRQTVHAPRDQYKGIAKKP